MNLNKTVIADLGNSRVKFKIKNKISIFDYDNSKLDDFLQSINKGGFESIYYSSVNSEQEKRIITTLNSNLITKENVRNIIDTTNPINFSAIKGIGTDRILSLLAVYKLSANPMVTIDCGTAVSINLLDENNYVLGGVILPGFYTQAKALNFFTADLPLVEKLENNGYFGENTEDAIKYGILNSIVGAIKTTIDHSSFSSVPDVFVTGGYGREIQKRLLSYYPEVIYDEHLVLKGIESIINQEIKVEQFD